MISKYYILHYIQENTAYNVGTRRRHIYGKKLNISKYVTEILKKNLRERDQGKMQTERI